MRVAFDKCTPEILLARVRDGDQAALGQLLDLYRNYLRVVARAMIGQALRVRLDASDLVQETFLKAHQEFGQFLGGTEPELTAWLRQILVRTLANQARHHRRKGRDYQRDEPLEVLLERSSSAAQRALAAPLSSPSCRSLVANNPSCLPTPSRNCRPTIARSSSCVIWSTFPSSEIAVRMGRSAGAARMLWTRTIKKLSQLLEEDES